jgi:hypothetical protein
MLSTQSLREQLDRYAAGDVSAEALEHWLAAESWDMRRWVPIGLQRFIEAMQAMFIRHSDGEIDASELRGYLFQRRDQLHRADEQTKKIIADRQKLQDTIRQSHQASESISGSQAISLKSEVVLT